MNNHLDQEQLPWDESKLADYDGFAIVALDTFLEDNELYKHERSVLVGNKHTGTIIPGLGSVQLAWARYEKELQDSWQDTIGHIQDNSLTSWIRHSDIETALLEKIDHDTAQLILEGRLRVIALLRTRGGLGRHVRQLAGALAHWSEKKGKVGIVCSEYAASGGASLALLPARENRYCTPDTDLMFHQGETGLGQLMPKGIRVFESRMLQQLLATFNQETQDLPKGLQEQLREKLMDAIQNPFDQVPVRFNDSELQHFRMISNRVTFDDLALLFEGELGIEMKQNPECNPMKRFIELARIQHDVRMQFGLQPWNITLDWQFRPDKHLGKLHAFSYHSMEPPEVEKNAVRAWNAMVPLLLEAGFDASTD
ncbi:MAG: ATP-dependent Clp protease proteolytic subunit [Patescibacteria group bacterium]